MKIGEWRYGPPFLTSVLNGGEWSGSLPGIFTSRETAPGTHWTVGRVGPRAAVGVAEKRKIPAGNRTLAVHLFACLYIDRAIMANLKNKKRISYLAESATWPYNTSTEILSKLRHFERQGVKLTTPPASTEVKKIWIYTSTPPYALMA
jgi:hypothetical protein